MAAADTDVEDMAVVEEDTEMTTWTELQSPRIGIGWRPELALAIERYSGLAFVEVIAEDMNPCDLPLPVRALRDRGVAVIPHGVGLGLGQAEGIEPARLRHLADLACTLDAPMVSEHIAFVRADGLESGHLLPLPRTSDALAVLTANVNEATAALPVPLALENIAALFEWPESEMDEAEFLAHALYDTGTRLLLDVSNLYGNSLNYGIDTAAALDRLPLTRVAYLHVGGGVGRDGVYHDTHCHPVMEGVVELLEEVCCRTGPVSILLERDGAFPSQRELFSELETLTAAAEAGCARGRRTDAQ